MKQEVYSKVPELKEMGGYIPGVDYLVHVEFTFKKFKEYADYMKSRLAYWIRVPKGFKSYFRRETKITIVSSSKYVGKTGTFPFLR